MSLFQFGFSISSTRQQTPHAPENIALAASHLPDKEDTILGRNEYNQVAAAVAGVKEIVNSDKPLPPVDPFEEIYQA